MNTRKKDDLAYGKVGRAFYDEDANRWEFDRSIVNGPVLHLLHSQVLLKGLPYREDEEVPHRAWENRGSHRLPAILLTRIWPAFIPAWDLLLGNDQLSAAIERTSADLASISGSTIILTIAGKIRDAHDDGHASIPVIAFADGFNGSSVRVCFIDKSRFRISNTHDKIKALSFSTLKSGWWDGPGARIKQVEAQTVHGRPTGLFGVLFSTLLCLCRVNVADADSSDILALEVDCVYAIDVLAIGLQGAAHFAFHSENTASLGIIDRNGRWIVGILPSQGSEEPVQWTRAEEMSKLQKQKVEEQLPKSQDEVWTYLGWPLHGDFVILGKQSQLAVVNIKSEAYLRLPSLKKQETLVDVQLIGLENEFIIALTTKSLHLFPTAQIEDALAAGSEEFSIGLSVTHLRDPYYERLAMACLAQGDVIHVLIYGRTSTFASYYRFQPVNGRMVLVDSPRSIPLSKTDEIMQLDHFVSVMMRPVKQSGGRTEDFEDLIQLIILSNARGRVTSKIISTSQRYALAELELLTPPVEDSDETARQNEPTVLENFRSAQTKKINKMEKKLQKAMELSGEVEEDEEVDDTIPEAGLVSRRLAWYLFGFPEERQYSSLAWAERTLSDSSSFFAQHTTLEKERMASRSAVKSIIENLQSVAEKAADVERKLDEAQQDAIDLQALTLADGSSSQQPVTALSALGIEVNAPKSSEMVDELLMQWIPGNDMSTYQWDAVWTQGGKRSAGPSKKKRRVEDAARYQLPSSQVVAAPTIREGGSSQPGPSQLASQRNGALSIREREFGRLQSSQFGASQFGASQASSSSQRTKKRKGF